MATFQMSRLRLVLSAMLLTGALLLSGAACQKKTTRKVTIEGPEKKTEIKLETTDKDKKDNERND